MVSIKDVAKRAGVAISTVSKVLNDYPNVSEKTKQKVNKAVEELNFVPNSVAAALSSKQSGRVAILLNLDNAKQAVDEISMQCLAGAIKQAVALNLDVITVFFSMIRKLTMEEIVRYLRSQNITGLVIFGLSKDDKVMHSLIASGNFKIAVVEAPLVNEHTSCVWVDQAQAQYEVARKTIEENQGKSILYLAGRKNSYVAEERLKGIRHLAEEMDIPLLVRNGNFSELEARKHAFRYAKKKDVIVCASDLMAIGAMKALIEMDIFRPVCGFDGLCRKTDEYGQTGFRRNCGESGYRAEAASGRRNRRGNHRRARTDTDAVSRRDQITAGSFRKEGREDGAGKTNG